MSHPHTAATTAPATRHDGWTPERKARFLDHLAGRGNVRAACAAAGMSAEAAYRLRRRDHLVARAWAAALVLAREASAEELATRAIDGIEEEIWYRGELVGTRRKFDNRLLLAHMARLDRLAEESAAASDSARFDELLAAIAGIDHPEELAGPDEALPKERDAFAERRAHFAEVGRRCTLEYHYADGDPDNEERCEDDILDEIEEQCDEAAANARIEALARWDSWLTDACGRIDAMIAPDASRSPAPSAPCAAAESADPCTLSIVSTSPQAARTDHPLGRSYARA